ncbi:uncharacterized protein LOC125943785 [Dermacentor silvarum]|uniref:uncharacterized protein LOC125943785 n=1 Tax=Dermacentor silvarum TaxID=543639 RepID=UPI002100E203|nr:uncharacterized protein LOC125943785 [Dermacentor silvarum]
MDPTRRRGPYKKYLRVAGERLPRETLRRWEASATTSSGSATAPAINSVDEAGPPALVDSDFSSPLPSGSDLDDLSCSDVDVASSEQDTSSDTDGSSETDNDPTEPVDSDTSEGVNNSGSPLFLGSPFTNVQACLVIMTLFFKFRLTRECLGQILFIFSALLPPCNTLPSTTFKFFKLFSQFQKGTGFESHFFCSNCHVYLEETTMTCPSCSQDCQSKGTFLQVRLAETLRSFLEQDRIYKYFVSTERTPGEPITDIVDGFLYQEQVDSTSRFNFSLLWNTDGVQVFKSSVKSLWPVHCVIPELPPLLRKKFQILTLLWFSTKPLMNTFLRPFCSELQDLASHGLTWRHPETGKTMVSYIKAPVSSVDAVARAMLQRIRQFNGSFGCSFCEHPGKSCPLPRKGHVHIYPPGRSHTLRNGNRMRRQAVEATRKGHAVKGVIGPTILSLIPSFDCSSGFIVDYMHCVLLGVVRSFLCLWLDSKHHGQPWYLGRKAGAIDERLLSVKPPDYITRTPRSVKHRCYWKASELRAWLLFYSFPVLCNILPPVYMQHFILLIGAIHMLLSESVSHEEIDLSEKLLLKFVDGVKDLYGERFCSFNVHQLTHIALSVRNWGPLWSTSAFLFENRNGQLLRLIKGTQAVEKQLASLVGVSDGLSVLQNQVAPLSPTDFLLRKIENVHFTRQSTHNAVLYHGRPCKAGHAVMNALTSFFTDTSDLAIYRKVTVGSNTFCSKLCTRQIRRNSYTVMYIVDEEKFFASIHAFVEHAGHLYLVVNKFLEQDVHCRHEETGFSVRHIVAVVPRNDLAVIPAPNVMVKCIQVLDSVCISPNSYEMNL